MTDVNNYDELKRALEDNQEMIRVLDSKLSSSIAQLHRNNDPTEKYPDAWPWIAGLGIVAIAVLIWKGRLPAPKNFKLSMPMVNIAVDFQKNIGQSMYNQLMTGYILTESGNMLPCVLTRVS